MNISRHDITRHGIDFEDGFFGRLRAEAGQEWTHYTRHPFVRQLGAGTLPQHCFKRFLTQDYIFLIHFARAYALLAYKHTTLSGIRSAATALNAIVGELPLHIKFCEGWGLSEQMIEAQEEAPETTAYTRFVLDIGQSGDILDLTVALMPCVVGYGEIGQILMADKDTVLEGNPYEDWLRTYEGDGYQASVKAAMAVLEDVALQRAGSERFGDLSRIFTTATRLEANFWQMGLNAC